MQRVFKHRYIIICTIFFCIVALFFFSTYPINKGFLSSNENIENFDKNYVHFNTIVKYLSEDSQCYFIYTTKKGIRFRDEDDNTLTLPKNIIDEFTNIFNNLKYESIQDCQTYICFGIHDDGHFEQEIYYIPDESILNADWFIPENAFRKIKEHWYYLEGKHEHI